jgi:DNA repair exonuclease SbcCD nuclease subunit
MRVVFTSDNHVGLSTEEIDRTDEIINILIDVVKHAYKLSKKERTILVIGGDVFNTNTPSEANISAFIRVLNAIKKCNLETYIMVGNHDSISDPNRLSCLNFIKKLKPGYPTVNLIEDIKFMQVDTFDNGPLYFTFLPHVSKALVHHNIELGKVDGDLTTQGYIDYKCERILTKVGDGSQHYVFSHVNVRGSHGGSEQNMLKKSEVYLPSCFTNIQAGYIEPVIVQAHLHGRKKIGNINIVGSPQYCGFGEAEQEKYFLEINIPEGLGVSEEMIYHKTNCVAFKQLEINMMNETRGFEEYEKVDNFIKSIEEGDIVKFDVTINPEHNHHDWKSIASKIKKKTGSTVKPIIPRVVLKRPVRSNKQKIGLDPKEAVKIFLKRNFKHDKDKARGIYKEAIKYLD